MTTELEPRCDKHAGDPYPSLCYACDSLAIEYALLNMKPTKPKEPTAVSS